MGHRIADALLAPVKDVPAATTIRQILTTTVRPVGRDQLARLALMPRLATRAAHRALVRLPRRTPPLGPRLRWIRRRRHRAVARVAIQPPLELLDAILQPTDHRRHRINTVGVNRLDILTPHERKIPCITQEPWNTRASEVGVRTP
jgi:hypothetical protein